MTNRYLLNYPILLLLSVSVLLVSAAVPVLADHPTAEVSITTDAVNESCAQSDACLDRSTVTIDVGGEVTWTNNAGSLVSLLSGTPADGDAGSLFSSGPIKDGATYTRTFEEAGMYFYFSSIQPWMVGTVEVAGEEHDDDMTRDDDHDDDHGDDHDDRHDDDLMRGDEPTVRGFTESGYEVLVWTGTPTAGERLEIEMEVRDSDGNKVEHLNHDLVVTQGDTIVLDESGAHHHEGGGSHTTMPLDSDDPVDIAFRLQGLGVGDIDTRTGPIGEQVVFTEVVPEFGPVAVLVLVASVTAIVVMSARSGVMARIAP